MDIPRPEVSEVLEITSLAGHILLENGAEIARVEETMERIASHYDIGPRNFFVLSNGIFTTGSNNFAKVEFIPFKGAQLERVVAVNQVSRDICEGRFSDLGEAKKRLLEIRSTRKGALEQILGAAIGSAGFCVIFGGGLADAAVSFVAGLLLWTLVLFVTAPHMSKLVGNILGGAFGTLLCIFFHKLGLSSSLGNTIIGALIPLIPGVPFINGIRDLANEDYIAGIARLEDALLVFFGITLGVSLTFLADSWIEGAMPLVTGNDPDPLTSSLLFQVGAAFIGTLGFAVLFGVPRKYYLHTAVCATLGWTVYSLLTIYASLGLVSATFVATLSVAVFARLFAVRFKAPETIFLITGIFPMVPGGGIFWTVLFLVTSHIHAAATAGYTALKITIAIVLGIVIVSGLPSRIFSHKTR